MRFLGLALFGLAVACVVGCNAPMGQSESDIVNESKAWENYNQKKAEETPLPPGDGPSN